MGGVLLPEQAVGSEQRANHRTRKDSRTFPLEHRHEFLGSVERPAREFGDGQAECENAAGGSAGYEVKEPGDGSIGELFDAGENQGGDDAADATAVDGENLDWWWLVAGPRRSRGCARGAFVVRLADEDPGATAE